MTAWELFLPSLLFAYRTHATTQLIHAAHVRRDPRLPEDLMYNISTPPEYRSVDEYMQYRISRTAATELSVHGFRNMHACKKQQLQKAVYDLKSRGTGK